MESDQENQRIALDDSFKKAEEQLMADNETREAFHMPSVQPQDILQYLTARRDRAQYYVYRAQREGATPLTDSWQSDIDRVGQVFSGTRTFGDFFRDEAASRKRSLEEGSVRRPENLQKVIRSYEALANASDHWQNNGKLTPPPNPTQ